MPSQKTPNLTTRSRHDKSPTRALLRPVLVYFATCSNATCCGVLGRRDFSFGGVWLVQVVRSSGRDCEALWTRGQRIWVGMNDGVWWRSPTAGAAWDPVLYAGRIRISNFKSLAVKTDFAVGKVDRPKWFFTFLGFGSDLIFNGLGIHYCVHFLGPLGRNNIT